MVDYSSLNTEQTEAVMTTEGFVRVIASAGSGKTRALTYRYAFLVDQLGISTDNIACITFTNKAAGEMKKRIRKMVGDRDIGYICTFHSLGNKILKEDIHVIKWPNTYRILDEADTEALLKRVYNTYGLTREDMPFKKAIDSIGEFKVSNGSYYVPLLAQESSEVIKPTDPSKLHPDMSAELDKIIHGYLYEQKKEFGLDYNDLLEIPLFIFDLKDEIRLKWAKRFHYVMVDEFQDTSRPNYKLCEAISSIHLNLFVVGDPDQLIYSWRGAKPEYLLEFDKTHPGTKTIIMNKNYRSNEGIVLAANSLIAKNEYRIPKDMTAMRKSSVLSNYFHAKTDLEEAEFVASTIETLANLSIPYKDIAVLYRAHYVTRSFEQVFIKRKIPYVITSGVPFYQRKEIKDIIAYLRFVQDENELDFDRIIRVPKRGIGDKRIAEIKNLAKMYRLSLYEALKLGVEMLPKLKNTKAREFINVIEAAKSAKNNSTLSDLIDLIYTLSGMEDELRTMGEDERLENIAALKADVQEFEDTSSDYLTLDDYLDTIALYTSADETTKKDAVRMMTIHASKGLEFPYVFVVNVNEGVLPSSKARRKEQLEEERRLAYVAFTRAKEELFISESEGFHFEIGFKYPSRFIFNTSLSNVKMLSELDEDMIDDASYYITEEEKKMEDYEQIMLHGAVFRNEDADHIMFQVGEKVIHSHFGEGKVIEALLDGYVTVDFLETQSPRRISIETLKTLDESQTND